MHRINTELPLHQGVVTFRNTKALVISKDKASAHAKNFRLIAKMLEPGKYQDWLNEMGEKFGAMEEGAKLGTKGK